MKCFNHSCTFSFKRGADVCEILPNGADPTPTSPAPTEAPPTLQCGFETDFCGFEVSGDPYFNFTRSKGEDVEEGQGPTEDADGNT